jgi:hypothetical protein
MILPVSMYAHLPALLILISLVYSATRYDEWPDILSEALRWGSRMFGFMLAIAVVMYVLTWGTYWVYAMGIVLAVFFLVTFVMSWRSK